MTESAAGLLRRRSRPAIRPGWAAALGSVAVAVPVTAVLVATTSQWPEVTTRVAVVGLGLLVAGIVAGSDRAVGLAAGPLLVAALLSVPAGGGLAWGRTMAIGCGWYVASELAWASIAGRRTAHRSVAIGRRRIQEVATVVAVSVVVGLGAAAGSLLAPERTIVVRAAVVVAGLAVLLSVAHRLRRTAPPGQLGA